MRYSRSRYTSPTKVTVIWQQMTQTYAIKFHDTNHWDAMQAVIILLKSAPHGSSRDYDPETKTWYITEEYLEPLKVMLSQMTSDFAPEYVEKPQNTGLQCKLPDIDIMKKNFLNLTQLDKLPDDFSVAKKAFYRASLRLHPDKHPLDSSEFYILNEAWQELEFQHYKTKTRVTELKDEEATFA